MPRETPRKFFKILEAFSTDLAAATAMVAAAPSYLKTRSGAGETVLHWLVVEDVLPAVEALIQLGADVNTRDLFHATPLLHAATLGYGETCALLLRHGAGVEAMDKIGTTPLMAAAAHGYGEICQLLLRHGADPRQTDPRSACFGRTALSRAAQERHLDTLRLLLSHLPADESLIPFFSDSDLTIIFETGAPLTALLRSRGLSPPVPD